MMNKKPNFLFGSNNYRVLLISLVLLCFGFILMIGGGSNNLTDFNPEIFAPRRIIIAPIIIIISYIGVMASIFYND
ncbi:MAG: hypothetical protein CMD26_03675 [Flavobacteriales bacterium]|nr:hypothetical protein [Flavobacteriales bacterium]